MIVDKCTHAHMTKIYKSLDDFVCLGFWKMLKIDLISQHKHLVCSKPLSDILEWASWNVSDQHSVPFVL